MELQNAFLLEIVEALKSLGGQASLSDIYDEVEYRQNIDLTQYTDWKAQVRKRIYLHSSDTDIFKGTPNDLSDKFYSIDGKGKGYWGLRQFIPSRNQLELTEDDIGFVEGKKKLRQHIIRERNPLVIKQAKETLKKQHDNRLFCEICGFDFYETYGEIGEDFIEGHHTIPLSEMDEGHSTKVEDIAIVCSNCHRMLHRRRPWLSKDQLKLLIEKRI
ncbi:HNH endonuclease [Bacillus safensis]|uniref:HNH endonuclease n=1 Tax=Bacillus safensis TaxID=561879 RepID=UPI0018CE5039|nr:HNH endonuclease [Bacillus safensis]MBG9817565.1 restriction endonuclease [Bacillus safensis]